MQEAPINLSQLEGHLWESANILRGPVDAADFKTYIFPLLFFKRICDVWDEEYAEIVDETGDAELALFPESHRFQIPDDCHWNDARAVATNVGNALQRAMREIEKANPDTLYGGKDRRDADHGRARGGRYRRDRALGPVSRLAGHPRWRARDQEGAQEILVQVQAACR